MAKRSILVVFGADMPNIGLSRYDTVLQGEKLKKFLDPGSIYEAANFAEELSRLNLPDGRRISKSFIYEGFELWWIHYNSLYYYFCFPFTQYKKLLEYLKDFESISFYKPPYKNLFHSYLTGYGREIKILPEPGFKNPAKLPFGVLLQILITLISLTILMIKSQSIMIFIGDKFEKDKDYDFRMKFIYAELRSRNLQFVEFIRSLESWKVVLQHAIRRKRPVVYSEAVAFVGRFMAFLMGDRSLAEEQFGPQAFSKVDDPFLRFKLLAASEDLRTVYSEVWSICIMKLILKAIRVKSAFITAALERNFHAVLGAKLNNIPTVGILHGAAPSSYNVYDFLPGFDGDRVMAVDKYGLWSDWWKDYYIKHSRAYRSEQLYVSGPMRPVDNVTVAIPLKKIKKSEPIKALFISEQLAVPEEVLPYLEALMQDPKIEVAMKLRPYRDGFEEWLTQNRPDLLKMQNLKIVRGNIQEAIEACDTVVGSHSTAVLEALYQLKKPILFNTRKWGDCFSLKEYGTKHPFFAESPKELLDRVKLARSVPQGTLQDLLGRYFGNPHKNGSAWVVDQLETAVLNG